MYIIVGLIRTPLAGILAGFIYSITGMMKPLPFNTAGGFLAAVILFGSFGSIFAAPTTVIGLPVIAYRLSPNDRRLPLKLALSGFALGWLTMIVWCAIFVPYRWPHRFPEVLEQIIATSAICIVGAICGALTGLLMAKYGPERNSDERVT